MSYNGGIQYTHAFQSRHNGSALAGNAVDVLLYQYPASSGADPGLHVLSIDAARSGSVGINVGVTAPSHVLHVKENITSTKASAGIMIENTNASGDVSINLKNSAGTTYTIYIDHSDGDKLKISGDLYIEGNIYANNI
jgi:hypothetical protein